MTTYIILLRAVNVSGKNIIKMAELKSHLENTSFHSVKTYIQSGNIILKSDLNKKEVEKNVSQLIKKGFDLDVQVFVLTEEELQTIIAHNPFPETYPPNKVYITILDHVPSKENMEKFSNIDLAEEQYVLTNDIFYFYVPEGMANAKLSNPFIENKLKVKVTGRNLNTILKLQNLTAQIN